MKAPEQLVGQWRVKVAALVVAKAASVVRLSRAARALANPAQNSKRKSPHRHQLQLQFLLQRKRTTPDSDPALSLKTHLLDGEPSSALRFVLHPNASPS